jgi:uncharacterized protein YoxC
MGPGGIATIIAAAALFVIAIALAYAVIRLSKLIDEVQKTVAGVNKITENAQELTTNIKNGVNDLFASSTSKFAAGAVNYFFNHLKSSKSNPFSKSNKEQD